MSRSEFIISYHPQDSLPWYLSKRAYDEGLPVPGATLARCRDKQVAVGIVDRYMEDAARLEP